jgi:fused signal recognition particle receptor
MGLFDKLKQALFKTGSILPGSKPQESNAPVQIEEKIIINEEFFDDLFEKLIKADVGLELSEKIVEELKSSAKEKEISNTEIKNKIKDAIKKIIGPYDYKTINTNELEIFLIVGVNGSGKTTSIGKLANRFKQEGKKVLIAAGDTFRAAAGEQLDIWSKRAGAEIYAPEDIKKPDAVVFGSIEKAKKEGFDILLIDTAGRLQSQTNLMDELKKIDNVVNKNTDGLLIEKLIVLDATIGQNAISQAEIFSKVVGLTGIILSKLDGSAKGGVVLNIMHKLSLPVKIIGTGEKLDDIVDFNLDDYLEGLLS